MARIVINDSSSSNESLLQRRRWMGAKLGSQLRREDCKLVKHDKLFSKWKVLVGPSDSADHSPGKESGIGKCHTHNLPAPHELGPGVYELGVVAPSSRPKHPRLHHNHQTVKRENVIPVFIGHAANIRQRLQKYAMAGAHINLPGSRSPKLRHYRDNMDSGGSKSPRRVQSGSSGGELVTTSAGSGARLFSEVLALGSCIVFRWAQTDSKVVAEQVESELLAVFDYAWNKGASGSRRPRDILAKLFMAWPAATKADKSNFFSNFMFSSKRRLSGLIHCRRKKVVGIKVALRKPQDSTSTMITSTRNSTGLTSTMMGSTSLCFLMRMRSRGPLKVASSNLSCGVLTSAKGNIPYNAPAPLMRGRNRLGGLANTYCSIADQANVDEKKQPLDHRRRHNSLSFNTWMKGPDSDLQRVHDSSEMNESIGSTTNSVTFHEKPSALIMTQYSSSRTRARHLGNLSSRYYASVLDNDTRKGR